MSTLPDNAFILTKSLFCLNHPMPVFMALFCNHSFLPPRGGRGPRAPHSVECLINGEWLCQLPLFSMLTPKTGCSQSTGQSQLQYDLCPWAASPAEIYRLCLSQ